MTKQDARKVTIIEELLADRIINTQAAQLVRLSIRQIQRIKAQAATGGILSILHKTVDIHRQMPLLRKLLQKSERCTRTHFKDTTFRIPRMY